MMRVAALVLALMLAGPPVHAEPANTPHALWEILDAHARRASISPEVAGSEITVSFTLECDRTL
ncbi:hypothetical protein MKK84_24460 [Methylobacterium sp. E-065]|uniref:hypothetical protein n=1 Tax=Methylobacterium sp. E-065 TaxID=2836583 RepID=UPI001FBB89DC|nr:hypothetical protein [Methylobacterium sp. E-065]MCJ2020541.1 hypothetical protein [Methylobacterium sp. E-065]